MAVAAVRKSPAARESLPQLSIDESDLTWRVIGTLNVFRLLLAIVLLVLFFAADEQRFFGDRYPALFSATAAGYLVFAFISGLAIRYRWVSAGPLIVAQVTVDIASIIILMHSSGGISSGLGALLIIFVGASSLVLPLRIPGFFAALASLAILGEQFFSQLSGLSDTSNYNDAATPVITMMPEFWAALFLRSHWQPDRWPDAFR